MHFKPPYTTHHPRTYRSLASLAALLATLFTGPAVRLLADADTVGAQAAPRPNILFILCDDLGFGDIGPTYQNERAARNDPRIPAFRTPELDRVAAEGLVLREHYSPAPVCAPSRASLLLGVHQGHSNVRDNQFDKALADNHTLATVLRQAGYATAAFGKWGLQGKVAGRTGDGTAKAKGKNKNKNRDAAAQKEKGNPAASGARTGATGGGTTGGSEEGGAGDVGNASSWPAYPTRRGFDFFHGYVRHGDGHQHYPKENGKQVWENDREISSQLDGCYTTDLFTARAKKWIVDHVAAKSGTPFFIYLAYDTPHAILQNPPCAYPEGGGLRGGLQWLGKPGAMINAANGTVDGWMHPSIAAQTWDHDGRADTPPVPWPDVQKRYANGVRRIDQAVGDLRALLRDLGIDRNTLIVFTSDNGPSKESYLKEAYDPTFFEGFGPFSGIKRDVLEGGLREPTLVVWPGHVPAGRTIRNPSAFWDWMPTFVELAGLPAPAASDGVSLVPTLTGAGTQRPSTIYVEYFNNQRTPAYEAFPQALRGRTRQQMQMLRVGGHSAVRYQIKSSDDAFSLYDVTGDPRQARPLSVDAAQQRVLQARVLQVRRPDPDAPRPYDDTPVPAAEVSGLAPGSIGVALYAGNWPWVPDFRTLKAKRTATVAAIDASVFASGAENGAAFSGYFHAPVTGDYAFRVASDGGATLFLHEARVIDDDFRRTGAPVTGTIRLAAGWHPLRLYTRHTPAASPATGARRLELTFTAPGAKAFAPIPAAQLAPAAR